MAKKANPATKATVVKPANSKTSAAKAAKAAASPAKKPVKRAAKPAAPRAAKKLASTESALPLGTAPPVAPPSLADRYTSFEEAKSDTIDTLLASIEAAEARLLEVKRAVNFDQLEPLANGAAS
jgi:hypothetical protein